MTKYIKDEVASKDIHSIDPVVRLWLLRILVPLNVVHEIVDSRGMRYEQLATILGIDFPDPYSHDFDPKVIIGQIYRLHRQAEKDVGHIKLPYDLAQNIEKLGKLIELNDVDKQILALAISLCNEPILNDCSDYLGDLSAIKTSRAVSAILQLPERNVRQSLDSKGTLIRSSLLNPNSRGRNRLQNQLDLLSDHFADHMSMENIEPIDLLSEAVVKAHAPILTLQDFPHIKKDLSLLLPYLTHAVRNKKAGVNIYIHGVPGTGKTQLARVLAQYIGCDLFEVATAGEDGDPIWGKLRLRSYQAAQRLLAKSDALLVFDEVEDVFSQGDGLFARPSIAQENKGWVNRTLEENAVPCIWISNSLGLDPAFVRRFDMIIELDIAPKEIRQNTIQVLCGDLIDSKQSAKLAAMDQLAPAVLDRASEVVRTIQTDIDNPQIALDRLINNTLRAQGHQSIGANDATRLLDFYQPEFVQADTDLSALAKGVAHAQSARLCFYGPSGTGKTAYARWLAEQLNKPLIIKRNSDLLSMYVGNSEKNIANAFKQAESQDAILLIDEVDSLLADRHKAKQSWEISQVNEMLTAMESFSGIFIASTNLVDNLDQASLRRFDLKIKFDYLATEQSYQLLACYCEHLNLNAASEFDLERLKRINYLTPGDFASVLRRQRFSPLKSCAEFVQALERECELKKHEQESNSLC